MVALGDLGRDPIRKVDEAESRTHGDETLAKLEVKE